MYSKTPANARVRPGDRLSFVGLLRDAVPPDFDLEGLVGRLMPAGGNWKQQQTRTATLTWTRMRRAPGEYHFPSTTSPDMTGPITVPAVFATYARPLTEVEREGRPYLDPGPLVFAYLCITLNRTFQDAQRTPQVMRPYVTVSAYAPALWEQEPHEWFVNTLIKPLLSRSSFLFGTRPSDYGIPPRETEGFGWDLEESLARHCRPPFFLSEALIGPPPSSPHADPLALGGGLLCMRAPDDRFWAAIKPKVPANGGGEQNGH